MGHGDEVGKGNRVREREGRDGVRERWGERKRREGWGG